FLISIIVFRQITLPFIHSRFSIYYTIFLALFAVFMLIRPASNPKKRMYQTLIYIIVRKKDDYSAIDYSIKVKKKAKKVKQFLNNKKKKKKKKINEGLELKKKYKKKTNKKKKK